MTKPKDITKNGPKPTAKKPTAEVISDPKTGRLSGRKPKAETPANDAGPGVVISEAPGEVPFERAAELAERILNRATLKDPAEVYAEARPGKYKAIRQAEPFPFDRAPLTFSGYDNLDELPEPDTIGTIADVLHASGFYEPLTPAQIAACIVTGRDFELDGQAWQFFPIFDRHTGKLIRVEQTKVTKPIDAAAELSAAIAKNNADFPEFANKGDLSPFPEKDDVTPAPGAETMSAGGSNDKQSNVIELEARLKPQPFKLTDSITVYPKDPETGEPVGQAGAEIPEVINLAEPIAEALNADYAAGKYTAHPAPDPVTPEPASAADNAGSGVEGPAESLADTVKAMADAKAAEVATNDGQKQEPAPAPTPTVNEFEAIQNEPAPDLPPAASEWRQAVSVMCQHLNIDAREKLAKFDACPTVAEKGKYHQAVKKYYDDQTATLRGEAAELIKANMSDGVTWPARAFFETLGVGSDQKQWNYADARNVRDYFTGGD